MAVKVVMGVDGFPKGIPKAGSVRVKDAVKKYHQTRSLFTAPMSVPIKMRD
jgi:hypothetical protein